MTKQIYMFSAEMSTVAIIECHRHKNSHRSGPYHDCIFSARPLRFHTHIRVFLTIFAYYD